MKDELDDFVVNDSYDWLDQEFEEQMDLFEAEAEGIDE